MQLERGAERCVVSRRLRQLSGVYTLECDDVPSEMDFEQPYVFEFSAIAEHLGRPFYVDPPQHPTCSDFFLAI